MAVACGASIIRRVSIRIDIAFAAPLDRDAEVRLLLAAATLPEVRRAVLSPDRRSSTWYAGELPCGRVVAALTEAGLSAEVRSGLAPEAEAELAAPAGERYRPMGR